MLQSERETFHNGTGISDQRILDALRAFMALHALLDLAAAIPLFFTPSIVSVLAPTLSTEAFTLRIVAGALTAISYASAKAAFYEKAKTFIQLLQFKCVWSTVVWIGLAWSIGELRSSNTVVPTVAWITLAIFIVGSSIWNLFNWLLMRMIRAQAKNRKPTV